MYSEELIRKRCRKVNMAGKFCHADVSISPALACLADKVVSAARLISTARLGFVLLVPGCAEQQLHRQTGKLAYVYSM